MLLWILFAEERDREKEGEKEEEKGARGEVMLGVGGWRGEGVGGRESHGERGMGSEKSFFSRRITQRQRREGEEEVGEKVEGGEERGEVLDPFSRLKTERG